MSKVQQEIIDPLKAQLYLSHNTINRRLDKRTVECYAELMKRGLWGESNDAICFTKDGALANGQHRLNAVIIAGGAYPFIVMRGLCDSDMANMDNGKNRTAADNLYIKGVKRSNAISAIIKRRILLGNYRRTVLSSDGSNGVNSMKIHNKVIMEEYEMRSGYYDSLAFLAEKLYSKNRLLTKSDYGGFISYLNLNLNHPFEACSGFFDEFVENVKPTNDVVILLRNRLLNDRISMTKMTGFARQKLIIKAWNAWITGKTVKRLKYDESTEKGIWFI